MSTNDEQRQLESVGFNDPLTLVKLIFADMTVEMRVGLAVVFGVSLLMLVGLVGWIVLVPVT